MVVVVSPVLGIKLGPYTHSQVFHQQTTPLSTKLYFFYRIGNMSPYSFSLFTYFQNDKKVSSKFLKSNKNQFSNLVLMQAHQLEHI